MEAMLYEWDCIAKNLAATRVSTRHARVRAPQSMRRQVALQYDEKAYFAENFV
jgi:hypothetical protein